MHTEIIIGFDIREMFLAFEDTWSLERKKDFLIKHDIQKPLSVDHWVWNSVFYLSEGFYISGNIIYRDNSWEDLVEIKKALTNEMLKNWTPCWIIAITRFFSDEDLKDGYRPTEPAQISDEWKLLGYDVAVDSFLSALTNMGTGGSEPERDEHYRPLLNQYHLFTDPKDAFEFAQWMHQDEPLHGPYEVYGIYLIEEIKASS